MPPSSPVSPNPTVPLTANVIHPNINPEAPNEGKSPSWKGPTQPDASSNNNAVVDTFG